MLTLLTGFEASTGAATARDAWMLIAVLRVCAALLIAVAALLVALRGELAANRRARRIVGIGLAGAAVVLLTQALAIFATPAAWLFGATLALVGVVFLLSARGAAPRPA
jgi:hypothetical protein